MEEQLNKSGSNLSSLPIHLQSFPHGDIRRIDKRTVKAGDGKTYPDPFAAVDLKYEGYKYDKNNKDNAKWSKFTTDTISSTVFETRLGNHENVIGLEQAVLSMTKGEVARVWIPSRLGYGVHGAEPLIPPNSDLAFELTLVEVRNDFVMDDNDINNNNNEINKVLDEFAEMEKINDNRQLYGDLFDKIDPDDNGDVDEREWIKGLKKLNIGISESEMSKLFKLMDNDKSGYIDRQDWITFCMTTYTSTELKRLHDSVLLSIKENTRRSSNLSIGLLVDYDVTKDIPTSKKEFAQQNIDQKDEDRDDEKGPPKDKAPALWQFMSEKLEMSMDKCNVFKSQSKIKVKHIESLWNLLINRIDGEITQYEDICCICYCPIIDETPIKLECCGVSLHYDCLKEYIKSGFGKKGDRITLKQLSCLLCRNQMKHKQANDIFKETQELYDKVSEIAIKKLKDFNKDNDDAVIKKDGEFYNNPAGYSMKLYSFFLCYECNKPYWFGLNRCGDDEEKKNNDNDDEKSKRICDECEAKTFFEWKGDKDVKKCPKCDRWVEKNGGCMHMTCLCGIHWCWICNKEFPEETCYDHTQECEVED